MAKHKKMWMIFFSGMAVLAMMLLSAGMSRLELLPGQPFSFGQLVLNAFPGTGPAGESPLEDLLRAVWIVLAVATVVLLPFSIVYFIVSRQARKRVLRNLLFLAAFLIFYYLVLMRARPAGEASETLAPVAAAPAQAPAALAHPSEWLVLWVSLSLAALLMAGAWRLWRRARPPASPLEQLAQEAQDALEGLRAGADLKNTVIRCYFEMSRVLRDQQGIRRQKAMTPREFERRLEEAGLPGDPVRRLTRLFEGVRYGARLPGEVEEREAVACLAAIVQACGRSA